MLYKFFSIDPKHICDRNGENRRLNIKKQLKRLQLLRKIKLVIRFRIVTDGKQKYFLCDSFTTEKSKCFYIRVLKETKRLKENKVKFRFLLDTFSFHMF